MSRSTSSRKYATHLHLTREPGLGIAGRDEHGQGWRGIDATKVTMVCALCGGQIQYGYMPESETAFPPLRACCVACVEFGEREDDRR